MFPWPRSRSVELREVEKVMASSVLHPVGDEPE
jgi:hypothetical protein